MARKPFIAANWKMNKTISETKEFFSGFIPSVKNIKDVDIVIAPPFTLLAAALENIKGTNISLASQNVFYEEKGAFTGEVSPVMVKDSGCSYAIIGHSERRQYFNETDEMLNKKTIAAQKNSIKVIFCIGESLEQRESGKMYDILKKQIENGLQNASADDLVVAYEPIWAIGTGKTATVEQAEEAHAYIREQLKVLYGNAADKLRIIYGGSVTPENIGSLMECPNVDGALVGGASLKPESFGKIVKFKP